MCRSSHVHEYAASLFTPHLCVCVACLSFWPVAVSQKLPSLLSRQTIRMMATPRTNNQTLSGTANLSNSHHHLLGVSARSGVNGDYYNTYSIDQSRCGLARRGHEAGTQSDAGRGESKGREESDEGLRCLSALYHVHEHDIPSTRLCVAGITTFCPRPRGWRWSRRLSASPTRCALVGRPTSIKPTS